MLYALMKKRQVGIFSGSFDPIHVGHLMVASYMCEFTCLDEVRFVVTPHNPLKDADHLSEGAIRLKMVELGVSDFRKLKVSDVEFRMPKPSYTCDTLAELSACEPDSEFSLIIGGDNWRSFSLWKNYKLLLQRYSILIYPRWNERIEIDPDLSERVRLVEAPIVQVSSTFIRNAIRAGKEMRGFVPGPVYDFIQKNKLYK